MGLSHEIGNFCLKVGFFLKYIMYVNSVIFLLILVDLKFKTLQYVSNEGITSSNVAGIIFYS